MHGETHGHHICSRCGWPYPNPHPSAKHRRSHKKVCGKVVGYKISEPENGTHLAGSDEEHHSAENSNKVEEESSNVKGIGEIDRQISNKPEEEEFSDAIAEFADSSSKIVLATTSDSVIHQSNDPSDGDQIQSPQASKNVEDQIDNGTKQDHASSSDAPSVVGSNANIIKIVYPENAGIGEHAMEVKQVSDMNIDDLDETLSAAIDASAGKSAGEESEIDANLKEDEISSDVADAGSIIMTDNGTKEGVIDSKVSQDEFSPDNGEGCNVKEVNVSRPVILKHAHMDVEELPEMTVEKPGLGLIPDCSKVIDDTELYHENGKEAHSGSTKSGENADFTVSEAQVLEDNLQQELPEMTAEKPGLDLVPDCSKAMDDTEAHSGSTKSGENVDFTVSEVQVLEDNLQQEVHKIVVQEVIVEGQADISVEKHIISKGIESDGLEVRPDTTDSVLTLSKTEKEEIVSPLEVQESHCGQDESNKIVPEAHLVAAAGGVTVISSSNTVIHEAIDVVSGDDVVWEEEAKADDSDVNITRTGGAIGENFTKTTNESPAVAICLSESINNLRETECTLDTIGASSSGITTSKKHSENMTESMSDVAICQDQDFQEGSKEIEVTRSVDLSLPDKTRVQMEPVALDSRVTELLNEERKSDRSGESGLIHSPVENSKVEDLLPSAVNKEVEDNNPESSAGDSSNVHSQSLQVGEDKSILKQQYYGPTVGPRDLSADTISQTDGLDGNCGSVSDGAAFSRKGSIEVPGANNSPPKEAAEITHSEKTSVQPDSTDIFAAPSSTSLVEPGKEGYVKSAFSEIEKVINPEQVQPSSLTTQNESEGKKKNEKIIEKVASWDSEKSHTSLRSLLVGVIDESNPEPVIKKNDVFEKQNDYESLLPKTVNPTTATANDEKEWDSPARLPVTMRREKRKTKQWVPFMCCSSAVN